jgi:hypothetical protein
MDMKKCKYELLGVEFNVHYTEDDGNVEVVKVLKYKEDFTDIVEEFIDNIENNIQCGLFKSYGTIGLN